MRKLILILFILLSCASLANSGGIISFPGGGVPSGAAFDCAPYASACQQLEAVGYDNGESWDDTTSANDAIINPDYAVTPIAGGQSLYMLDDGVDGHTFLAFSAHADGTTTGVFFQIRIDIDTSESPYIVLLYDWSTSAGTIRLMSDGMLDVSNGTQDSGGSIDVSGGGVFDVWYDWRKSTGGDNGIANIAVCAHASCNGVRPANNVTLNWGDSTLTGIDQIYFSTGGTTTEIIYDTILVDTEPIGNVPNIPAAE